MGSLRMKMVLSYRDAARKSAALRSDLIAFGPLFEDTIAELTRFEARASLIARAFEESSLALRDEV